MEGLGMSRGLYLVMRCFRFRKSKREFEKVLSDMNTAAKKIITEYKVR